MRVSRVCIFGGTGFVGRALAERLTHAGIATRVVTRVLPRASRVAVLPTVEVRVADVHDDGQLAGCLHGMDVVVNLVGILHEGGRQGFRRCHEELPRRIATASRAAGAGHFVHVSALGASDDAPSAYLRSKAAGEAAVRNAAGGMPHTIFRPSVIFGADDQFTNRFAALLRVFPFLPLARADARFQPVWVEDVARCLVAALGNPAAFGRTYDLCGPEVHTLAGIVRATASAMGRRARIVALPGALATLQALVFERLPGKLITRDNLRSMERDNVCTGAFPDFCDAEPASLESVLQRHLAPVHARARYDRFRHGASR